MGTFSWFAAGPATRRWLARVTVPFLGVLILVVLSGQIRADDVDVTRLPLTRTDAWIVGTGDEDVLNVSEMQGRLVLHFHADKGNRAQLLLVRPIPILQGVNDFTFLGFSDAANSGLYLYAILRDAEGKEFLAYTNSAPNQNKGLLFTGDPARRYREVRFNVPAISRPVNENLIAPAADVVPRLPLALIGFDLVGEHQGPPTEVTDLYLRDFALSSLTPTNTKLYYQFETGARYGELDPLPYVTLGHYFTKGRRMVINWEARKTFDGPPFLRGGGDFTLDNPEADALGPLKFERRIEFPITNPGTYWIRVKVRSYVDNSEVPDLVREFDNRLYIVRAKGTGRPEETPVRPGPPELVNLGEGLEHATFEYGMKAEMPVVFRKPEKDLPSLRYLASVQVPGGRGTLKTVSFEPVWGQNGIFTGAVSLNDLDPGAYEVQAQVLSGKAVVDQATRLVGKRGGPVMAGTPIPEGVPTWRDAVSSSRPLFQLSPLLPADPTADRRPLLKAFIDQMPEVSKELELPIFWKNVEPTPGAFNWSEIDWALQYAQSKGITVTLWPEFVGYEPEWVPSYFTQNQAGSIVGHTSYLFHGGRLNYWHSPVVREAAMNLIKAVVARYRSSPTVRGYYVLTEQPGDASWAGWYEGYDAETLADWRDFAEDKYRTLAVLNQTWGTNWTAWEEVEPPLTTAPPGYRRDWDIFRREGSHQFLLQAVRTVRELDDQRLIMVYKDGIDLNRVGQFRDLGCILANGGSQDPERGAPKYLASALQGLQERTEDMTPGKWGANPTVLDASLFAMTMGGGANTHCKAYMYTGKPFSDFNGPPYSLDRYKKFMPIWTELRDTVPMPVDTYILNNSFGVGRDDPLMNIMCFNSHLMAATGGWAIRPGGKLILSMGESEDTMEQDVVDGLVQFVQNGGTLVMRADSGRYCPQQPGADWVLLKRFGVNPPLKFQSKLRKLVNPIPGEVLTDQTPNFTLRDLFFGGSQPGLKPMAYFDGQPGEVAMSWRSVGEGKLVIVWAQSVVLNFERQNPAGIHSYLRDIANWSGVRSYTDATRPEIWTNLLQGKDGQTFYGLAYRMVWQDFTDAGDSAGAVRYKLPEGKYEVTEMISGLPVGRVDAAQMRDHGIKLTLKPRAVAIYRFRAINP